MRPANQYQAEQHMKYLINRKLTGKRSTKVREHTKQAVRIAGAIWQRFQVGPYQYQLKHLKWYLDTRTQHLSDNTRYRHFLTIKYVVEAFGKADVWIEILKS